MSDRRQVAGGESAAMATLRYYLSHTRRPLMVSAVVGTLLCLINDSYFQPETWRIALNYCVPFCVSFYSRCTLLAECARKDKASGVDD